jgi:hypothetical protein
LVVLARLLLLLPLLLNLLHQNDRHPSVPDTDQQFIVMS